MHPSNLYICCIGETLWDMLPTGKQPGGAPMNVCVHLHNLGLQAFMISCVGQDTLGSELLSFLKNNGCEVSFIQTDATHSTGYVAVELNSKKEANYRIVQPVAWDYIEPTPDNLALAKNANAVVFSTLMARSEQSRRTLLALLAQSNALKIYDVNFRQPHTGQALVEELMPLADILKLNEDEFNIICSWYGFANNETGLKELIAKYNLQYIILTRGENGAMIASANELVASNSYSVQVTDTVGSGDDFLAGFLKCYFENKPLGHSINYACALGAIVATKEGATPSISPSDITKMLKNTL